MMRKYRKQVVRRADRKDFTLTSSRNRTDGIAQGVMNHTVRQ
ncbi:hypothetical protein BACEGG_00254 [Bacteroides eggerthii DSM 20697]|nr:hypothetical protein BACEGG_00254 [Bacteroides eggerthii DSM 20697]